MVLSFCGRNILKETSGHSLNFCSVCCDNPLFISDFILRVLSLSMWALLIPYLSHLFFKKRTLAFINLLYSSLSFQFINFCSVLLFLSLCSLLAHFVGHFIICSDVNLRLLCRPIILIWWILANLWTFLIILLLLYPTNLDSLCPYSHLFLENSFISSLISSLFYLLFNSELLNFNMIELFLCFWLQFTSIYSALWYENLVQFLSSYLMEVCFVGKRAV